MYAVIFRATVKDLDDEYFLNVAKMRELAFNKYGCLDFIDITEGDKEVAISYWENQKAILKWKSDPEHIAVQGKGQKKWYRDYSVEIVEVQRKYSFG